MNILAINSFGPLNSNLQILQQNFQPKFGLTMASPLSKDTVSFGCKRLPTKKNIEQGAYIITEDAAKKIRAKKVKPHERKKQVLLEHFKGLIDSGLITFDNRLKELRSIREKATTNGWSSMDAILTHMDDISGFSIVLNSPKAFSETSKCLSSMLKSRTLEVTEGEYHRLAPKYRKNQIVESYDTIKPNELHKFKEEVNKIQNPTGQIFYDVDSRSGYSGLHLILRSKDGEKSELQIMVRPIAEIKHRENPFYKEKNGKDLDPIYDPLAVYLAPFKPLKAGASESEHKAHEQLQIAMTKYTQEAYALAAKNAFNSKFEILKVEDSETLSKKEKEILNKFSFDKIAIFMDACEKMAK